MSGKFGKPLSGGMLFDEPTSEAISLFGEENDFADAVDKGHKVDPRLQKLFVCGIVMIAVYAFGLVLPTGVFNMSVNDHYSLAVLVDDVQENVRNLVSTIAGQADGVESRESWMCCLVVTALAGAGLAMSGAVYQGSFKNALVSPSTLGVMSGSSLGMVLWVVFMSDNSFAPLLVVQGHDVNMGYLTEVKGGEFQALLDLYSLALCSFAGCIAVVGLVLLVLWLSRQKKTSGIMLIIVGQVIGAVMGTATSMVTYYYLSTEPYGAKAELLRTLQIASFYRPFTVIDIVAVLIPLVLTFAVIMALRQKMMLLAFEEGEVRAMGINAAAIRVVTVALCTLLTAIIVSFCGTIGFVGFFIPHLARRLVGPSFKYLMPMSALLGGLFVMSAYLLINVCFGDDLSVMTGMFISIGGAAVFLVTAIRQKGASAHADWK